MARGPLKFDGGKIRLELIPPELVEGAGRALTFGARKYAAGNWALPPGFDWSRLLGGLKRHITEFEKGNDLDPESNLCHLDHASCMLAFLMAHRARGIGRDDRTEIGVAKRLPRAPKARTAPRRPAPKAPARRRASAR